MPGEAGREHKRQGATPLWIAGAANAAGAREGQVRCSITLSLALVLVGIAIAACGDTKKGGGPGGPLPYCLPGDLQIPVTFSPADGEVIDILGLTFHWVYNPAGCIPEEYQLQVSQSPAYESCSGASVDVGVVRGPDRLRRDQLILRAGLCAGGADVDREVVHHRKRPVDPAVRCRHTPAAHLTVVKVGRRPGGCAWGRQVKIQDRAGEVLD